ncbi:MAG: NIF family HAD-type phosphatase [Myxococcota bacterium]
MILALDLEGTLITNAVSQFPRPGLREFLEFAQTSFERVVIYTAVSENRTRPIIEQLYSEGVIPDSFATDWIYVDWSGAKKDLRLIPHCEPENVLLVDDQETYILETQLSQWIPIVEYAVPDSEDQELFRVRRLLEERLR